jgi:LPS sulfotransferase NodH
VATLPRGIVTSLHLEKTRGLFARRLHAGPLPDPAISWVFLCFTNRSGSNHLAELLASGRHLNQAEEIFNWDEVDRVRRLRDLPNFRRYVAFKCHRLARNGRFATKLAVPYLPLLRDAGLLDPLFANAHFIHITRTDTLAQAISYDIAVQTEAWASYLPRQRADTDLTFDAERLAAHQARFATQNAQFRKLFDLNAITPIHVTYETLTANPQATIDHVAVTLGLPPFPIDPTRLRLTRQASPLNAAWRARFLAERGGEK